MSQPREITLPSTPTHLAMYIGRANNRAEFFGPVYDYLAPLMGRKMRFADLCTEVVAAVMRTPYGDSANMEMATDMVCELITQLVGEEVTVDTPLYEAV